MDRRMHVAAKGDPRVLDKLVWSSYLPATKRYAVTFTPVANSSRAASQRVR